MHTLTVKWLIQLPSLWLESWNPSTSPALDAVLRTADLLCSRNCSFGPFDQLLPTTAPSTCLAPGSSLVLGSPCTWVTVGWGPWGGHDRPLQGLWVLRGLGGRRCRGQPSSRVLAGVTWAWRHFTLLPTGRHHPSVGPPEIPTSGTSDGPAAFTLFRNLLSCLCSPGGLWSFTWKDP